VSERLAAALARAGVCVTSGLALGVDGSAHAGALRAHGDTVAVLGAAPDVAYPRFHRRLHEAIAERGLLVSEFVPGTRAAPHHFPRRNRILAGLAQATVVVEAGSRSGSLITVDHALDLGRDVWAVPGPIDAPTCRGSNRLLADGARPLVSIDDFVDEITGRRAGEDDGEQTGLFDDLAAERPLESRILEILRRGASDADELAHRLDAPVATILAHLTTLELHGEVERLAGMRFRRAA
jgi:DNA processing protein